MRAAKRARPTRLTAWAALALVSASLVAAPQTLTLDDPRSAVTIRRDTVAAPAQQLGVVLGRVSQVVLAAPDARALAAEDAERARSTSAKVLRYGIGRTLAIAARDGNWIDAPGGRLWVLEVGSENALALRLHFTGVRLPPGARLSVVEASGSEGSAEPWDVPAAAVAGVWSPSMLGATVRIEYFAPAAAPAGAAAVGAAVDALPFRLDRLQHLYLDPVRTLAGAGPWAPTMAAGACHNDAACQPEWKREERAVAGLGVVGQDSLFCTGQLVNDLAKDFTPYFLTAHHCVSTPEAAKTAEVYWFYQSRACGETPPTLASVPRSVGATLVSTAAESDYTLLLIEGKLPHGVAWAGWTANPVPDGTDVAVIHHPSGDFKRISFGDKGSALDCGGAQHVRVRWSDGPTEPGSSGSGAFRADTHQLFGQLHCGPSACGEETYDQFGSFAATYPRIASFLAHGSDDDAEPNESCPTARLVGPGTMSGRTVTYKSPDWYRVRVPAGKTLRVTVRFAHQDGVVEAALVTGCGQTPKIAPSAFRDRRVLQAANPGASTVYTWKVELPDDLRNDYRMTVEFLSDLAAQRVHRSH